MKLSLKFRLFCIAALYVLLCVWYVERIVVSGGEVTLLSLSPIIISGVIIFVPLYKKYFKQEDNGKGR